MPLVDNLDKRFRKHLEFATHVDIAVAWATSGPALDCLVDAAHKHKTQVCAIVGTYGNATEPDALEKLKELGELRLVPNEGRLFHPKVYMFRGDKKEIAWIGSANFTRGGFQKNEEAVFETRDLNTVNTWFKHQWKECGPLPPNAIADYRKRWVRNPPSRSLASLTGAMPPENVERLAYIKQAHDWSGYVRAIEQCQDWWVDHRRNGDKRSRWRVYGKKRSWAHTIEKGRSIARKRDWSQLSREEAQILLGLYHDDSLVSGLLGDMTRAKKACTVFSQSQIVRRRVKGAVSRVIHAPPNAFPDVVIEAIGIIKGERGFGMSVATRLLALARPDRIVSLNSRSKEQLKRAFPEAGGLSTPNRYGLLLEALYRKLWYGVDEPSNNFERKLWSMRAALLDCFVYLP